MADPYQDYFLKDLLAMQEGQQPNGQAAPVAPAGGFPPLAGQMQLPAATQQPQVAPVNPYSSMQTYQAAMQAQPSAQTSLMEKLQAMSSPQAYGLSPTTPDWVTKNLREHGITPGMMIDAPMPQKPGEVGPPEQKIQYGAGPFGLSGNNRIGGIDGIDVSANQKPSLDPADPLSHLKRMGYSDQQIASLVPGSDLRRESADIGHMAAMSTSGRDAAHKAELEKQTLANQGALDVAKLQNESADKRLKEADLKHESDLDLHHGQQARIEGDRAVKDLEAKNAEDIRAGRTPTYSEQAKDAVRRKSQLEYLKANRPGMVPKHTESYKDNTAEQNTPELDKGLIEAQRDIAETFKDDKTPGHLALARIIDSRRNDKAYMDSIRAQIAKMPGGLQAFGKNLAAIVGKNMVLGSGNARPNFGATHPRLEAAPTNWPEQLLVDAFSSSPTGSPPGVDRDTGSPFGVDRNLVLPSGEIFNVEDALPRNLGRRWATDEQRRKAYEEYGPASRALMELFAKPK